MSLTGFVAPALTGTALRPGQTRHVSTGAATTPVMRVGVNCAHRARIAAAAAGALLLASQPSYAAVMAPECYAGVGPGCDAQAAESPLVRELLEKSRENREKNERATREKYWDEGYKSYFSFGYDRVLTKQGDGTYTLERPDSMIAKTLRSLGVDVPSHGGVELGKDGGQI